VSPEAFQQVLVVRRVKCRNRVSYAKTHAKLCLSKGQRYLDDNEICKCELLPVRVIEIEICVFFIESDHFLKGVVRVQVSVILIIARVGLALLHEG